MKLAFELGFIAIILIGIWAGYKKGLIMGVGGICVLIVATFVGNMLSLAYSQEVITAMEPFASGYVNSLVKEEIYEALDLETSSYSSSDLYEQNPEIATAVAVGTFTELGIYADAAEIMAQEAIEYSEESGEAIDDSITQILCSKIAYVIGFLIFAALCLIILTVVGNIANFSYRIPYFGIGNEISGALIGLATGIMFCMAVSWALRFMGIILPENTIENTSLAKFFIEHNLLTDYLGI